GPTLEQPIDGGQSFGNALRVVEAIDADADERESQVELLPELRHVLLDGRVGGHRVPAVEVDADGRRDDARLAAIQVDLAVSHAGLELVATARQEVATVAVELERDEIVRQ